MTEDLLDDDMRGRIEAVASRLGARPGDVPTLGYSRADGTPSCWRATDGWHLSVNERDRVMSDRHTTDPNEFLGWVAESVAEKMAGRRHPPEEPDSRRASWHEQYRLLAGLDQTWADSWLTTTRSALIAAGAEQSVLDKLPTQS
ncbi:Imm63 family immunity protein [Aldersonia kunmingensis]|uniref:Imm63 family immunity protein n=1 Tax=Aldersonia kunmingensis TaxID=408066 RepID=UPI00082D5BBA|nr:Imm63 family immunity protein [Aldersonia kunmingensis]